MDHRIQELSPVPLKLFWHENKTTYLSIRKDKGHLSVRIHRLFYDAPTPVLQAVIDFALKKSAASRAIIKQMAHLHFSQIHVKGESLTPEGEVYNLQEIYDRLLSIAPISDVSIGWSNRARKGKFRFITFGTFDKHCRQIRINPLLDDKDVPLYFLEFIVYHEMVHALCPTTIDSKGRCSVHTAEFKAKEREFPQYAQAKEWEKTSLNFFKKRKSHGRP